MTDTRNEHQNDGGESGAPRRQRRGLRSRVALYGVGAAVVAALWFGIGPPLPDRDERAELLALQPAGHRAAQRPDEAVFVRILEAQRERAAELWSRVHQDPESSERVWSDPASWRLVSWTELEAYSMDPYPEELPSIAHEAVGAYHESGDWRALESIGAAPMLVLDRFDLYSSLRDSGAVSHALGRWSQIIRLETARAGWLFEAGRDVEAADALCSVLAIAGATERGLRNTGLLAGLHRLDSEALGVWSSAARAGGVSAEAAERVVRCFARRAKSRMDLGRAVQAEAVASLLLVRTWTEADNLRFARERAILTAGRGADYAALERMTSRLDDPRARTPSRLWRDGELEARAGRSPVPGRFWHAANLVGDELVFRVSIAALHAALRESLPIAAALEAHRLEHGEYPELLSDLTPRWLDELPTNPLTEQPTGFSYKRANGQNGEAMYVLWAASDASAAAADAGPGEFDLVVRPTSGW